MGPWDTELETKGSGNTICGHCCFKCIYFQWLLGMLKCIGLWWVGWLYLLFGNSEVVCDCFVLIKSDQINFQWRKLTLSVWKLIRNWPDVCGPFPRWFILPCIPVSHQQNINKIRCKNIWTKYNVKIEIFRCFNPNSARLVYISSERFLSSLVSQLRDGKCGNCFQMSHVIGKCNNGRGL